MPRIVYDDLTFFNQDGSILRDIMVSRKGLSIENARFLIAYNNKDIDEIVFDITLYSILFNYSDLDEISKYVDDFYSFMQKFVALYQYIQINFPNKVSKAKKSLEYTMFNKGLFTEVDGDFNEHDYKKVDFSLVQNNIASFINSYPLIPEFAEKLLKQAKSFSELSSSENIIKVLSMCYVYFGLMANEYKDDSYLDSLEDVSELLDEFSKDNLEYANFLEENLIYQINPADTMCTNIDKFCDYLVPKLIKDKNKDAIKDLRDLLLEADTENPDFRRIVNNFTIFLEVYDFNDEYTKFNLMRKKLTDREIVLKALLYFYSYYATEECQVLINEGNEKVRV